MSWHRYWSHNLHSVHMIHLMFTPYFVMQHPADRYLSFLVFSFFWCCSRTLGQGHVMFPNLQITQTSKSQLNFENQWRDCQYLQAPLLILKDLHSFSPVFVPALIWQCFSQDCLFAVFWLQRLVEVLNGL